MKGGSERWLSCSREVLKMAECSLSNIRIVQHCMWLQKIQGMNEYDIGSALTLIQRRANRAGEVLIWC